MEALEFYRKHDLFSDPGAYASRYVELPTPLNALHAAINELLIHNWKVERDRPGWIKVHPEEVDVFTRPIYRVLERVALFGPEPWNQSRPPDRRVVIDCRHFSLLLCSILRERGIPARTRCGFATYLEETHGRPMPPAPAPLCYTQIAAPWRAFSESSPRHVCLCRTGPTEQNAAAGQHPP